MRYIDHHAHMVSRTTDDYAAMALSGCVAVTEPAFWAGWDRSTADGFEDYFKQLTEFEPKRAAASASTKGWVIAFVAATAQLAPEAGDA